MAFAKLGLHSQLVKAVSAAGYAGPTPVQERAIPAALTRGDLLVSSHTGSGKTAAFMLPCLHRLAESTAGGVPRVLVLTPTRELALQVATTVETYGKFLKGLRTVSIVGGVPFFRQQQLLRRGADFVVATPGRLLDHLRRSGIDLSGVETLVLDEADRMLDMGFIDDIALIVARTPSTRQTLLFSATLDGVVGGLASRITRQAQRIEIAQVPGRASKIDQRLYFADDLAHKSRLLDALLRDESLGQALIFTATKRSADELSTRLRNRGIAADALHGDMNQSSRNRTLQALRHGRLRVLVATDIAARGLDVPGISHVINFDLPRQADDYVHRIGRTGRAGRDGVAISLAAHRDKPLIRDIERYTAQPIAVDRIPGLEPTPRPSRSDNRSARPYAGSRVGCATNRAPGSTAARRMAPAAPVRSREATEAGPLSADFRRRFLPQAGDAVPGHAGREGGSRRVTSHPHRPPRRSR
ncbi:MAG: DEAD/DEAH box helicase [Betaproteobacteria bacterium]|nr:DEAD/DEAH box helicase [Betaproteobacteria bacterium]